MCLLLRGSAHYHGGTKREVFAALSRAHLYSGPASWNTSGWYSYKEHQPQLLLWEWSRIQTPTQQGLRANSATWGCQVLYEDLKQELKLNSPNLLRFDLKFSLWVSSNLGEKQQLVLGNLWRHCWLQTCSVPVFVVRIGSRATVKSGVDSFRRFHVKHVGLPWWCWFRSRRIPQQLARLIGLVSVKNSCPR